MIWKIFSTLLLHIFRFPLFSVERERNEPYTGKFRFNYQGNSIRKYSADNSIEVWCFHFDWKTL